MKTKLKNLFDFMTLAKQAVFIDDFSGWGTESEIINFKKFRSSEGNGIEAVNGSKYEPQCATLRRGNHIVASLRKVGEDPQSILLGELFPDMEIVIQTSGEALRLISPIFSQRKDAIIFLAELEEYCGDEHRRWFSEIAELVTFLFRNNPDKIEGSKTVYDL